MFEVLPRREQKPSERRNRFSHSIGTKQRTAAHAWRAQRWLRDRLAHDSDEGTESRQSELAAHQDETKGSRCSRAAYYYLCERGRSSVILSLLPPSPRTRHPIPHLSGSLPQILARSLIPPPTETSCTSSSFHAGCFSLPITHARCELWFSQRGAGGHGAAGGHGEAPSLQQT